MEKKFECDFVYDLHDVPCGASFESELALEVHKLRHDIRKDEGT